MITDTSDNYYNNIFHSVEHSLLAHGRAGMKMIVPVAAGAVDTGPAEVFVAALVVDIGAVVARVELASALFLASCLLHQ